MWYGFVTRQRYLVTQNWDEVKALIVSYPYASFRKFSSKTAAWEFVESKYRMGPKATSSIRNFGETIPEFSADLSFFITSDALFCNIVLPNNMQVKVISTSPNISVSSRGNLIMICNKQLRLRSDSLRDRAVALHSLLRLIGPILDVNILVPDMSTFYLFQYRGSSVLEYVKLRELVNSRLGKVGLTVGHKQYVKV